MEAALLHSSADHHQQPMSPCKRVRNPKRNNNNQTRPFIRSRANSVGNLYHSESLPKMEMMVNGGAFFNPWFPLSTSSLPRLNSSPYPLQFQQPPLLPLPTSGGVIRGNSDHSPTHKKQNKGIKHQTNAKPYKPNPPPQKVTYATNTKKYPATKLDANRLGPDPESLPRDLTKFKVDDQFPQAPPPSSLPMPKFSLKPKVSCKMEASSVDDAVGATNGLCRLLNLR